MLSRIWVGSFIPAIEVDTKTVGVCTFIISFTALLLSKPPKAVAVLLCLKGDILKYGFLVRYWVEALFQHILSVTYSISTGKA